MDLKRKDLPNIYLLIVDLCCIVIAFLMAAWIRYGGITNQWLNVNIYSAAFIIVLLLYIVIYYFYDTYSKLFKRGFVEEIATVIKINGLMAVSLTVIMYLFREGGSYSRLFFICFFMLNILVTYVARQYYKIILLSVYRKSKSSYKIMIITTFDQVKELLHRIRSENDWEYQITCLTILDRYMTGQTIDGIEIKADRDTMFEVAKQEALDGVFIHIPSECHLELNLEEVVLGYQNMGITVDISINTLGLKINEKVVREMSGYHVLTFSSKLFSGSQLQLKRLVDIVGGVIGCIVLFVLTIFIAPAIRLESRGPVFFSQTRIGRNGRRFRIYKFRSMFVDAEARLSELMKYNEMNGLMFKMKDDPRITKVGKFLRKTSLDEFPQFINILKGDMSLVGTRPPTEGEFLHYEGRHKRRLALKSGLTGLWQVSGRSDISNFEEVVKLDLEYIDNWSIMMDIKILFKTVGVVLFHKGSR